MKLTTGYKKPIASSGTDAQEQSSNNSYLLLAGGGHKALSELVSPADLTTELSNYVTIGSNQTITGVKTFSQAINADITGNADTVDGEHAVAFAHIGAHNNLIVDNEFTFASSGFSGDIWFNYRTAGGTNGNITDYIFGNGKGGQLYSLKTIATNASTAYSWGNHANVGYLLRSDIGSQSVNYATNAGNAGTLNGHTADDFVLKTTHDVYESVIVESLNDLDNRKIEISDLPTSLPANGGHAATATNVDWSGVTNKPSSFPANGGNADTINGYSSSDFVLNTNYGEFKSVVATALTDLDTRKVDVSDLVDYEVIITEQGASDNTLKSYVITQGGSNIGTISIPKDLILSSGSVVVGNWVNGIFTEDSSGTGKAIKLVISNQSDPIYINVQDLSDVYTVQQGATEVQLAISSTNEISAALVKNVRDKIDNAIPKVSGATGKVAQFKADGSLESSSYEIKQSVPSDAVFTDTTYSIATSDTLGLVKIGYTANDKNYPVQLSNGQMYVNVPWTDSIEWKNVTNKPPSFMPSSHTHTTSEITGLPTSLPANGGNSDTVDNMHASDFATAGHTHSDYVTALGTSDIYLTWTKNGNTSNIIVPYAESAGDAGTLGGWHKSAFATAKHTHTTSEITNFPTIGNGALHIKVNGTELTPEGGIFTANKSGDSTIDLKESLATRPELNTLGSRVDKIDTSILELNTAVRVDNPFDDSGDDDEDTIESNDDMFGDNVVGSIDLRFYGITSEITLYVDLHVHQVNVAKICDISEVGNSISSLYNIRITIDLTGTTIASTVGISSDTFKQFYIRGANMKNHICGFDVRGNGTTNTATAIMSGNYLLLNCQLKLHGDKSDIGSFIMEEAKNVNFKAYLCLRQTI